MSAFSFQLRRERSVVEVVNATFEFIRVNATVFGKTLLYIVAPIGIVLAVAATALLSLVDWEAVNSGNPDAILGQGMALLGIAGTVGLVLILMVVGTVLILVATMSIVECSERRGPGQFDLMDVRDQMKANFGGLLLLAILSFCALYIPYIVLSLASVFGLLLYLLYWMYVQPRLALMYAAYVIERKNGMDAIRRAHELTARGFWSTLGLYVLVYILVNVLSGAAAFPMSALAGGVALLTGSSPDDIRFFVILFAALYGVLILVSISVGAVTYVAMSLQYFHLVEKEDHVGLRKNVDALAEGMDLDESTPPVSARHGSTNGASRSATADRDRSDTDNQTETTTSQAERWGRTSRSPAADSARDGENSTAASRDSGPKDDSSTEDGTNAPDDDWTPPGRS